MEVRANDQTQRGSLSRGVSEPPVLVDRSGRRDVGSEAEKIQDWGWRGSSPGERQNLTGNINTKGKFSLPEEGSYFFAPGLIVLFLEMCQRKNLVVLPIVSPCACDILYTEHWKGRAWEPGE